MVRNQRSDNVVDYDALLRSLGRLRGDVTSSMARMQIGGPLYQASAQLLDGIDALAHMLTGRREALHAPAHGRR